jgi:hypothetical protein
MNPLRAKAFKMRIAGKSYNEINVALGVPKSTLNSWFSGLVLSDKAQVRLKNRSRQGTLNGFVKRNKLQTKEAEKRAKSTQRIAKAEIPTLTKRDLKIIGATLYWAEGYKRLQVIDGKERMSHIIRFVNSDGQMIRVFIRFLREIFNIPADKIHLTMRLFPHINENEARNYWMEMTGIGKERFYKTTYYLSGASKGIRPFNRLPWGTLSVEVCSTTQFHHLLGWIEGVKARL